MTTSEWTALSLALRRHRQNLWAHMPQDAPGTVDAPELDEIRDDVTKLRRKINDLHDPMWFLLGKISRELQFGTAVEACWYLDEATRIAIACATATTTNAELPFAEWAPNSAVLYRARECATGDTARQHAGDADTYKNNAKGLAIIIQSLAPWHVPNDVCEAIRDGEAVVLAVDDCVVVVHTPFSHRGIDIARNRREMHDAFDTMFQEGLDRFRR